MSRFILLGRVGRRSLAAVLLLACLVVVTSATVSAREPSAASVQQAIDQLRTVNDPEQVFAQLPPNLQQAVEVAVLAGGVTTTITYEILGGDDVALGASNPCRTYRVTRRHFSIVFNTVLGKYESNTHWCWDGTYITNNPHFYVRGTTTWPMQFRGNIYARSSPGPKEFRDFAQGRFEWCLLNCVTEWTPWIHKIVYGTGGTWSDTGE